MVEYLTIADPTAAAVTLSLADLQRKFKALLLQGLPTRVAPSPAPLPDALAKVGLKGVRSPASNPATPAG